MNCLNYENGSAFNEHPLNRGRYYSKELPNARERISMACIFIEKAYTESLTRCELSSLFGMNEDTFSRYFNRYKGIRLNDYINTLRIMHAMKLLLETDYTITQVSIFSGFDNIRTFNRAFRKAASISPSEYRDKCAAETDSQL